MRWTWRKAPAPTPAEIADVAQALGDVAELAARYDTAEAAYKRAREAVPDDAITNCHLLRKQGIVSERRGRYTEALELYESALGVLEHAEDEVKRVRSRSDVELAYAGVKLRQGQFDEARTWAERAAASADAGDGSHPSRARLLPLVHRRRLLRRARVRSSGTTRSRSSRRSATSPG